MAKAHLLDNEEVNLVLSAEEVKILFQLLGRFNPEASGALGDIFEELQDLGVEGYENVSIWNQSIPNLFVVIQNPELDNEEEE